MSKFSGFTPKLYDIKAKFSFNHHARRKAISLNL